jgi:hypothetical protein
MAYMRQGLARLPDMTVHKIVTRCVLALVISSALACGTRVVKTPIIETPALEVTLQHKAQGGTKLDRDLQHPANISKQRLANILSAIDVSVTGDERKKRQLAAIHPELLAPISAAMSKALSQADSSQEVMVVAVRKQRRLGLFNVKYLTTLTAFVRNDRLYVYLSRVEWEIPKDRKNKVLPQPDRSKKQMAFRTVPGHKMTQSGSQGLAVRWHDPLFSGPPRAVSQVGGARRERTVLMESPIPQSEQDDEPADTPRSLSPEALRGLADLEEERRAGKLTEAEYEQRREALLGRSGP